MFGTEYLAFICPSLKTGTDIDKTSYMYRQPMPRPTAKTSHRLAVVGTLQCWPLILSFFLAWQANHDDDK